MSFKTRKDGQVFHTSGSGISSTSIGAPVSSPAIPLDFPGQRSSDVGGGPFSAKHTRDRFLNAAKNAVTKFNKEREDLEAGKKAKDFSVATLEAEPLRKEEVKERTNEIKQLKEFIAEVGIGRTKKQKESKEEFKNEIKETITIAENEKKLIENMNWANTQTALKFAAQAQGDKEAQKILEAIQKQDFKKAKKLAEERAKRTAKIAAENSRIASEEGQEILTLAGLTQNAQGQYIPTADTPEIALANLGLDITPEELATLTNLGPIQAPPKIDPQEVILLGQSPEGTAKLRQWGYIK